MEHQTKVLKLSNGEEIITVISSADKAAINRMLPY